MGWLRPGSAVRCPNDHRLKFETDITEDGFLWCRYRPAAGEPACGARLFAIIHQRRGMSMRELLESTDPDERWKAVRVFLVEVQPAEIEYMLQRQMDADEMLEFLGCVWGDSAA